MVGNYHIGIVVVVDVYFKMNSTEMNEQPDIINLNDWDEINYPFPNFDGATVEVMG